MDWNAPRHLITAAGTTKIYNRIKILTVLLVPLAMELMAISSINVALPTIESSIGASDTSIQWMLSGYALTFGICLVAAGRIGDVIGRGTMWVVGVAIFVMGSLISGVVDSPHALNVARAFQGIGAGVYNPQTIGMIQQYFKGHGRARAFSLFGLVVSASVAVGPLVTGLIIGMAGPDIGWRASFLWNVPIGIVCLIMALAWFPFDTERRRRLNKASRHAQTTSIDLDPVAMVLLAVAVLCVMLPFMIKTLASFALLSLAAILLIVWVRWERHYKARGSEPMVNLDLFKYRSFTHATAISGTQFLGGTSIFVLVALFMQHGLGVSALMTGLIGLPNAAISAYVSVRAGTKVIKRGRDIVIVGLSCIAAGVLATIGVSWIIFHHHASFWWLVAPLCLIGFGNGLMAGSNQTLSMVDIPNSQGGVAGAVKSTTERIATAIGNAMITAVFFSLTSRDWPTAIGGAYGLITIIMLASLGIAIFDRCTLGAPAVPRGGKPTRPPSSPDGITPPVTSEA